MTLKLVNRGSEGELLIDGRLDSTSAPETEEIITQTAERFDTLVLNLAGLEYVSSAGLRIFKQLHIFMKKKNGNLYFKNVNKTVMEVFEITGLVGLFSCI